jgi:predicted CoA-binding protein
MADTDTYPVYDYAPQFVADILRSVKTIAVVGASANETKASNDVLRVLHEAGYEMLPVNPNPQLTEIHGLRVYHSLQEIDRPIDMVDVFRPKEEFYGLAEQTIEVGAKVLWGQLGVYDDRAAALAEAAGLKVIMDRCPKIELRRL